MVAAAVVSLVCLAASAQASVADMAGPTPARVRSSDSRIVSLLDEGAGRSETFRGLLDAIARSPGIVYVEFGYCAFGHLNGCLLPFVAASGGARYLRIVVTSDASRVNHDRLIALIGHELRHAAEVIQDERVVDVETMEALYRRIGRPIPNGTRGFETTEALLTGDAVLKELSVHRR